MNQRVFAGKIAGKTSETTRVGHPSTRLSATLLVNVV